MSKFSLFTLFISATVVIIVAELLVNNYIDVPDVKGEVSANLLKADEAAVAGDDSTQADASAELVNAFFNFGAISSAGFKDVSLQKIPFNGVLFESIDLRDFKSVPVIANNLLRDNRKRIATFYEFTAGSRMLGKEVYGLLVNKSGKLVGATVNASNEFGEGSFYINYVERPDFAFLVVNGGEDVYALTYLKELHPLVKNVLAQVSKPQ